MTRYWKLIGVITGGLVVFGLDRLGINAGYLGFGEEVKELVEITIMSAAVYFFPANT